MTAATNYKLQIITNLIISGAHVSIVGSQMIVKNAKLKTKIAEQWHGIKSNVNSNN